MTMKTCTVCGSTKPKAEFFKRTRAPDVNEAQCKECRTKANKKWFAENTERHHALTRKWYAEHSEYHLAKARERYLADPVPALIKSYQRCERTKQSMPPWADRGAILEMYRKARRLTKETGIKYEVDHAIPLRGKTVSGLHVHTNLQVITARENKRKFNSFKEENHA